MFRSAGLVALPLLCITVASGRTDTSTRNTNLTNSCLNCHLGIEEIHPGYKLSCVDCHGGDDTKADKKEAHVLPKRLVPNDERVLPQNHDLAYQRFRNPSNLRVADRVCGTCHGSMVTDMLKSPHGTTTGHLGDGFYEHGLAKGKKPSYSIFPVRDLDGHVPPHGIAATTQVPGFRSQGAKDRIETHYSDLPRKACMQCHFYSEGRAVNGRLGLDGDYRGEGCAGCHVTYAEDGLSRSGDPTIDKREPGHALKHEFTSKIPTSTCVSCHYGDASIGLHFRGMAQLVPGMPAGPQVKGTTDRPLNGVFYIQDETMTPPDIHHQKGMHCIDCHTVNDVMGDGNIYPQMDFAVEIECTSCHGTFDRVSDLMTSHGNRVSNLRRSGDEFFLVSKVTGKRHKVTQVKHVLDPKRPEYNRRAAAAMNQNHQRLECYTCHNGWNVNFFGFHFDRNEQFTQLDLISGQRTPGRVTTQEKVFATFNQLRLGFNHEGMIAPYLVGFSTIGSAHDKKGNKILHQATPETAAGLSGVTMIPHQMHTTRPEARGCVECHRTGVTYGLGSVNFRLTREFGYAVTGYGLHTIAVNGRETAQTRPVAALDISGEPTAVAIRQDEVHARATHAYVGCADGTLAIVSLKSPVMPKLLSQKKLLVEPKRMVAQGDHLYVADGAGGLAIFDIAAPQKPKLLGVMPAVDATSLALAWPYLCLADGAGGLVIVDVADASKPRALAAVDINRESSKPNEARDVAVLFQYSRTQQRRQGGIHRTRARHLAFVAGGLDGLAIVDFTEPTRPVLLSGGGGGGRSRGRDDVKGVAVNTVFDIGSEGGGFKSQERDYCYLHVEAGSQDNRQQRIQVLDISDPLRPRRAQGNPRVYGGPGKLVVFRAYNAPFLSHFVVSAGSGGVGTLVDVGKMRTGAAIANVWEGLPGLRDLVFEEFAFDRLQDERGQPIKDISHEGCRYLTKAELLKVLRVQVPVESHTLGRYGERRFQRRGRRRR